MFKKKYFSLFFRQLTFLWPTSFPSRPSATEFRFWPNKTFRCRGNETEFSRNKTLKGKKTFCCRNNEDKFKTLTKTKQWKKKMKPNKTFKLEKTGLKESGTKKKNILSPIQKGSDSEVSNRNTLKLRHIQIKKKMFV